MIQKIYKNAFRFIILLLLQVLVLNHVQWSGFVNPYIYILFILLLPIETPKSLVLILGFFIGLVIDMFSNTSGLHAAACTLIAFARPSVLNRIAPREEYEAETPLTPQRMGFKWFFTYALIMTLIHHLAYFYIEVFRFSEFFLTLFKALLNTAITVLLMIIGMYLTGPRSNA